jgi:hypothetical protein
MAVPIFDTYHSILFIFVLLVYLLSKFKFKLNINLKIVFCICMVFVGIIMFKSYNDGYKITYPNNINHFEGRFIREDFIIVTNQMLEYMNINKDYEYLFVGSGSYYFRLVTDTKMGYLDLINHGNFGRNGSNKIIEMIKNKNSKNSVFVISKNDVNPKGQIDKNAINYIINNGKKIDSVQIYDFYVLN